MINKKIDNKDSYKEFSPNNFEPNVKNNLKHSKKFELQT